MFWPMRAILLRGARSVACSPARCLPSYGPSSVGKSSMVNGLLGRGGARRPVTVAWRSSAGSGVAVEMVPSGRR